MRLKKLILHGFKSFADRTEFVFDSPITGIVGPNGCGKSNVVDGFKWVLGEQSAKSLRGEAMLDVIFNGSGGRKPAGMAEVVLVFDNPRREDDTRVLNLDLDEVAVGRRLYRDGTSEYHLNNQTSRLKDIRELFLDTGVGVDAYSVIEQGRVAALLEANPAERRLIFEEAAGISKFKQRKKEAQRKLEKVDQNLLRVNDIVEEVEKRLRSVRVQAGRARTYQEYSTRLGGLRLTYALQDYHVQRSKLDDLEAKQEDAQFRLDDASADLARRQNELATKRGQFEELSQKRQQLDYELVQAKAGMQSAKQRQEYAARQLAQIAEQADAFTRDRENAARKLEEVSQSLEAETQALEQLTAELEDRRRAIDERQQAFREGQLQLNTLNQQIEQHKAAVLELMRKLATLNSRINAIEIERKNIAAQQERLAERRRVVLEEIAALEAQRAEAQSKLDETLAHVAARHAQLEARREEATHLGRRIATVSDNLGAAREHRSGLLSRQKLLKDLEARREGVSEGVKSVLRQRDPKYPFIRGLVADVLRVDVEFAHVVEAALDGRDQWLLADDFEALVRSRELLVDLEGRVNILCFDQLRCWQFMPFTSRYVVLPKALHVEPRGATPGTLTVVEDGYYDWNQHGRRVRMAVDLARFEPENELIVRHLLGRTVVVDDLPAALDLRRGAPTGFRYVTRGGEVLEADGTLRAGPLTAAMGIISRRSELEAITQQVAEVDGRIAGLSAELTEGNAAARELEQQQKALTEELYKANTLKVELTSRIAQNGDKQASLRREEPLLDQELQSLLGQVEKLQGEESGLVAQREAMDAEQADRQRLVGEDEAAREALAEQLRHTGEELTAARVEIGQTQEKQLAAQQHAQRQAVAKAELSQQVERLARSAEAVAARRGGVEEELDAARDAEAALAGKQETLAGQIESITGTVGELGDGVRALTGQVESFRATHAEVEQQLHALDKQSGETRVRLETLVQRTLEELQLNLPEQYTALSAPQVDGTPGPGYQPADMDWDAVAEEIKDLRDRIHRLGNVNLDSLGELDELEKREQFMTSQVTDLTESKRQLEELIDQINAESGLRFEQTFTAVREHFQTMFRKLFGGGKADVYLETEVEEKKSSEFRVQSSGGEGGSASSLNSELGTPNSVKKIDPLEAGIEIMAHPPGKKPVTISQLSGGEKTMTCVALLMSIFKSKPSPFCILDEVDAALDEANNQRFNLIVQEFLEQSQFIVITHSKRTMQMADVLYGVTMQEQGVSKRVAVKFDQVDSHGRINEQAAA